MEETDFDGWADLGAQRAAEDESLVQRYAAGEGRGQDMRPVRGFVRHVRGDIGPKGVICQVRMTVQGRGHEIVVWFYFPQDGQEPRPQTASVRDAGAGEGAPSPGDLSAMSRATAAVPSVPVRAVPSVPARGGGTAAPGATSSA